MPRLSPPSPLVASPVRRALRAAFGRSAVIVVASTAVNLLTLDGSVYMMQVYDRVLVARSVPTLVTLTALMAALYLAQIAIDAIRQRLVVRLAGGVAAALRGPAHTLAMRRAAAGDLAGAARPESDVERLRSVLAGPGVTALIDLPFAPLFLALEFAIHPALGALALGGAVLLLALPVIAARLGHAPTAAAARTAARRAGDAATRWRNAETAAAMGILGRLRRRTVAEAVTHAALERRVADLGGTFSSVSRGLRMLLQSALLGLGAWLLIDSAVTSGAILASSVLVGRALAPVDLVVAHWRSFSDARAAVDRLGPALAAVETTAPTRLPPPVASLAVEKLSVVPPGADRPVLDGIDFTLAAGDVLAVVGPSGAGKSSLGRVLANVWAPSAGTVRLDGATLDQWDADALGRHVGWVPQSVGFFAGTVAENIARLDEDAADEAIVAAARAAGVHDLVLTAPQGYDTPLAETGGPFSTGQRQRIALARALYGDPFLLVLDEANSNLDVAGETALLAAVEAARARGAVVVLITHRPALLAACSHVLVLEAGRLRRFGPRETVIPALAAAHPSSRPVRAA